MPKTIIIKHTGEYHLTLFEMLEMCERRGWGFEVHTVGQEYRVDLYRERTDG